MEIESHGSSADQDPPPPNQHSSKKPGGWKSVKYILGNESFEKLASMSLISNITVYLRTKYNMSGILLVNVVTIWYGTSNMASLAGAFVSDAYLGKFLTLFFGSIASLLGMTTVTLTAAIPKLRPPPCGSGHSQFQCLQPQKWQLGFLFAGLGLLSIGAGGIRPCNIAFGADQFDTTTAKGQKQLQSFFNWWYCSFTIALLIALTVVVYIQTNVNWALGFAIPTVCLSLSILIFLIGRNTYVYKKPQGSVFLDIAKVIVASFRKRNVTLDNFYDHPLKDSNSDQINVTKTLNSSRFKCLDKAAMIVSPSELDDMGVPKNGWRLCSVQQVEQMKCLVGIFPVWLTGIGFLVAMDQQNTFGVLQAIQMDRSIGPHFQIPPGWMNLTSMIALSIWIVIYERVYIPNLKKIMKRESRLTIQQRIRMGIVMSILTMLVAGIVERKRRDLAVQKDSFASPLSVLTLLPQFALSGLTEAFAAVALMEFFTTQMPESMRSVAGSMFFLSLSIASYLSSLMVNVIHSITSKNGKSPWLGSHDLNKHKLEYYYYMIAGLGAINFMYFTLFASRFVSNRDKISSRELELEESIYDDRSRNLSKVEENELSIGRTG